MSEKKNKNLVGEKILSVGSGVGVISGIEMVNVDEYYVVDFGKNKMKTFFPIKNNSKIRIISSKKQFEASLDLLRTKDSKIKFDSKKERVDFFNRALCEGSLDQIVQRLAEYKSVDTLTPGEKNKVKTLVETLELEANLIYQKNDFDSKKFVESYL